VVAAALVACGAAGVAAETPPASADAKAEGKADNRLPIPPVTLLADSEKQIREVFKDEYRQKDPAERTALAKKLLKLAAESKNDACACYVALREAKDLAASAGDLETAFAAVDALAQAFIVDAVDLKTKAATAAARGVTTPEAAENASNAGLDLVERLAGDSQFDAALKLLGPLDDLARRANKAELAKTVQALTKDIRAQQSEWVKVKPHFEKLKEDPDNPEAALAVAKYDMASKDDWEHALPLLAKCSVPLLKEAAAKDLAKPEEAPARADLGDLWWTASEKESGPLRAAMQHRAVHWYAQVGDGLSGARKLQIEKRMQAGAGDWTDLLKLANPATHAVAGKWFRQGSDLGVSPGGHSVLEIPRTARGSYELEAVFSIKEGARHEAAVFLPVGAAHTALMLDGWDGVTGLGSVNGLPPTAAANPTAFRPPGAARGLLVPGRQVTLSVRVRIAGANAEVRADLNGRKIVEWRGKQAALSVWGGWPVRSKSFGLGACDTAVLWHTVRLRVLGDSR